jgi:hypothetical protein
MNVLHSDLGDHGHGLLQQLPKPVEDRGKTRGLQWEARRAERTGEHTKTSGARVVHTLSFGIGGFVLDGRALPKVSAIISRQKILV